MQAGGESRGRGCCSPKEAGEAVEHRSWCPLIARTKEVDILNIVSDRVGKEVHGREGTVVPYLRRHD